jgi:hypothetical protein
MSKTTPSPVPVGAHIIVSRPCKKACAVSVWKGLGWIVSPTYNVFQSRTGSVVVGDGGIIVSATAEGSRGHGGDI